MNILEDDEAEWIEEGNPCDHFDGDCVADHDCINCWLMREVDRYAQKEAKR